nr:hypothetical protein [Tanacetum cinerariifolium]
MSKLYNLRTILVDLTDMALPPRNQKHQYLRYEGLQYTDADIADFESGLAKIYKREVHRVQVFDFGGLPDLMAEGLSTRMLMEHRDTQGQSMFTSRAWRRLFYIRGSLVHELILKFFSRFRFGDAVLDLDITGALQFYLGEVRRRMSWREFILALGLYTAEEMETIGFAPGPEKKPDAAAGAPGDAEDAHVADEDALAVPALVQAPQPPTPPTGAKSMAQRMARLEEDVHEIRGALTEQHEKSILPLSASTTSSSSDSFPSLTSFKTSDSLLEEFVDELAHLLNSDSTLPEESYESSEIATLLSSSFENEDKVFNPGILILGGTQIFNNESKDKDLNVNTSSEAFLILEERNFLSISSDYELFFHLELTAIETLLSFSSENEDKVFNPGILTSK